MTRDELLATLETTKSVFAEVRFLHKRVLIVKVNKIDLYKQVEKLPPSADIPTYWDGPDLHLF